MATLTTCLLYRLIKRKYATESVWHKEDNVTTQRSIYGQLNAILTIWKTDAFTATSLLQNQTNVVICKCGGASRSSWLLKGWWSVTNCEKKEERVCVCVCVCACAQVCAHTLAGAYCPELLINWLFTVFAGVQFSLTRGRWHHTTPTADDKRQKGGGAWGAQSEIERGNKGGRVDLQYAAKIIDKQVSHDFKYGQENTDLEAVIFSLR